MNIELQLYEAKHLFSKNYSWNFASPRAQLKQDNKQEISKHFQSEANTQHCQKEQHFKVTRKIEKTFVSQRR